ncbi:hypothetical protein FNF27_06318 [Cafeteria roenbergensis]|uniref:Uncharacterized protein n=1 Tax=Cafeteria roenbergensis TaxID=33653 RepID=A0A5A8E242_CAFRO|nr:hypothetical protein FNF27_06318 [Cafeteria roenbergensis]
MDPSADEATSRPPGLSRMLSNRALRDGLSRGLDEGARRSGLSVLSAAEGRSSDGRGGNGHGGLDAASGAGLRERNAAPGKDALAFVDVSSFASVQDRSGMWARAAAAASGAAGAGMGLGPDMFIKPIVNGMLGPSIMDFVQKMGNYAGSLVPARINEFLVSEFAGPTPLSIYFMIIDLLDMIIGALQMAFAMAAQLKMMAYNAARNAIMQANLAKAQADAVLLASKRAAEANMLQSRLQAIAVMNVVKAQMLAAKAALKAAAMAARAKVIAGMRAAKASMAAAAAQARAAAAMAKAMKGAIGNALDDLPRPPMPQLPAPLFPEDQAAPLPPDDGEAKDNVTAAGAAAAGSVQAAEAAVRAAKSSTRLKALADASAKAAKAASAVVAAAQSPAVPATTRAHLASVAARAAQVQSRAEEQAATVVRAAEALDQVADDSARAAIRAAQQTGEAPPPPERHLPRPREDALGDVGRAAAAAAESVQPAPQQPPAAADAADGAGGPTGWYDSVRRDDTEATQARSAEELAEEEEGASPPWSGSGAEAVDASSLLEELSALHDAHAARHRGDAVAGSAGPMGLRSGRPLLVDVALALRGAARAVSEASEGLELDLRERAAEGLSEAAARSALASIRAAAALPAAIARANGRVASAPAGAAADETASQRAGGTSAGSDPAVAVDGSAGVTGQRPMSLESLRETADAFDVFLQEAAVPREVDGAAAGGGWSTSNPASSSTAATAAAERGRSTGAAAHGAARRHRPVRPDPLDAVTTGPSFVEVWSAVDATTRSADRFRARSRALERHLSTAEDSAVHVSGAAVRAAAVSAGRALAELGALERAAAEAFGTSGAEPQVTMKMILEHTAGDDYAEMGEAEKALTQELKTDASKIVISVASLALTEDLVSDALAFTWPAMEGEAIPAAMEQAAMGTSLAATAGIGYAVSTGLVGAATTAVLRDTESFAVRALSSQLAGAVSAATGDIVREAKGAPPGTTARARSGMPQLGGDPSGSQPMGARGISRFTEDDLPACQRCARRPHGGGFGDLSGYLAKDAQDGEAAKELGEEAARRLRECDMCSAAVAKQLANGTSEQLAYRWVRTALIPEQYQVAWQASDTDPEAGIGKQ